MLPVLGVVAMSHRRHPGTDILRGLYVDEQLSSVQIAARYGVTFGTVCGWLKKAGLTRTPREAAQLVQAQRSPDEVRAMTAAMQDTIRGAKRSAIDLERRALGKERTRAHQSPIERELLAMLPVRAIPCKAIGPYNVDIAVDGIAVEVYGGGWHAGGRAAERWPARIRFLLDAGWRVVVVWVQRNRYPLTKEAADYILALGEDGPEYRVIRGTGQAMLTRYRHDDSFPLTIRKRSAE